ncbi:unnamed protein product [Mytilus coruscus]|uniref:NCAM n=1 Tax=Mytilus coruscus TaxID=42192 RepID=A0A6J8C5F0_MYTCO|nr:unnamed protein product [Mytilus coruscus]
MDRYRFRNILSIVLFSCDLVLTQDIIYERLGSTVELVCPIITTRIITWLGPSNYQHYAVGTEVFPDVSTQVAISETAQDKKSILLIHRFSQDNSGKFRCTDGVDKKEFNLIIKNIPKISFLPRQTLNVKEGEEAKLICINDGNDPNATTVWKRPGTKTNISNNDELNLKNVNRTDAGLYTCRVDTKSGVYKDNAKVVVQYAPTIDIRYFPSERKIVCIPSGVPDSYVFKDWEHTTEYNDHVRFLATTKEGNTATLSIPQSVVGKYHQRERGIYICRASNNISSTDGVFVRQKYNLNLTGTPYFVSSTENTQYGVYLKTAENKIKFVSVPEYNSYNVYKNGTKFADYTSSVHRNMKLTDNINGKNVSVKGSIISLQITIDTLDDFNSYKIVVKNADGCSNHTIELVSASAPFMPKILQTGAKQTQIFVLWIPGFNGGYPQWFIIEYKEIEDIYWNNQTTNSSNSTVIGGLQPETKYLIRMFSRNMIDDSNKTEEIIIQTADARANGNNLDEVHNGSHTNSDSAEIPVYSFIDKRHNLRLHQTAAYTVDQKGITNPLKFSIRNRETGKNNNRVSKFESMKCSSEIEQEEKESRELNYVEILFDQKPVYPFTIHGLDDKTNYVEIDFMQSADPLPESDTDSESEK